MSSDVGTGPLPVVGIRPAGGSRTVGRAVVAPQPPARSGWERRYAWAVVGTDVLVVSAIMVLGALLGYGGPTDEAHPLPWGLAVASSLLTFLSLAVWVS